MVNISLAPLYIFIKISWKIIPFGLFIFTDDIVNLLTCFKKEREKFCENFYSRSIVESERTDNRFQKI